MNGQTTNYTLDLNSGLTQVLSDDTTTYTYGLGRISQTNTTTEYFLGDALGSVRQLTNPTGEATFAQTYDPYGVVTQSSGLSHTDYGFTGETTDANGLVYLRARYYNPADGRFTSRDTWGGDMNRPMSMNRWNYVQSNPVNYVDPTGHYGETPDWCQWMSTKGLYESCILLKYGLKPINVFEMGKTVTGSSGCYSGPTEYRAPGYLEGADFVYGGWPMGLEGREVVYDFATMERSKFTFWGGQIGTFVTFAGGTAYWGQVSGFQFGTDTDIAEAYEGITGTVSLGVSFGEGGNVGLGRSFFFSESDPALNGRTIYVGAGFGASIVLDASVGVTKYSQDSSITPYIVDGQVKRAELTNDILRGAGSPFSFWKEFLQTQLIMLLLFTLEKEKKMLKKIHQLQKEKPVIQNSIQHLTILNS